MGKGLGKSLEKNFSKLISELFPNCYWPSRSGTQNGYDAYARFKFDSYEYTWRFELKDLNAKAHKNDFGDIKEIEIKDFADKILQLMSRENEATFPHVFCIVVPHKKIGNNNQLRNDLKSLNHFNKFPFEILILDFDSLFPALKMHHPQWVESFYPNAPEVSASNETPAIDQIIKEKSKTGVLYNRSYIKIRKVKDSVRYRSALHIRILPMEGSHEDPQVKIEFNGNFSLIRFSKFSDLSINQYPYPKIVNEQDPVHHRMTLYTEGEAPLDHEVNVSISVYGHKEHLRDIDSKKIRLVALFKEVIIGQASLHDMIKTFCSSNPDGFITFILDKNERLARVPFKEIDSSHFGEKSKTEFLIEYTENE
ncbi:MAG: hypothetical protein HQM16_13815 [Deltaproteobacteria bacterium]|nr:hypothetical protein [Deltaproteobacteria bacterium]